MEANHSEPIFGSRCQVMSFSLFLEAANVATGVDGQMDSVLELHRPIDPAGHLSWSQALASGVSRTMVAAAVLASLEADEMQVQALYNLFLRRPADSAGLSAYTSSLQSGVTTEEILASILGSDEYYSLALGLP